MLKSSLERHPGYFQAYIDQVVDDDLLTAFSHQYQSLFDFLRNISEAESLHAYAPGKWTIKGVLQHMIDAERIFAYRALRFARKDATPLPGWEENDYGQHANAEARSWHHLLEEFLVVRQSTEWLFKSFTEEMLLQEGTSNNNRMTVATIGFTLLGHCEHHKTILIERYLSK